MIEQPIERITKAEAFKRIHSECYCHVGDKRSLADEILKIIDLTKSPSRRYYTKMNQ